MSNRRYTPEFKDEAVRQVVEREIAVSTQENAGQHGSRRNFPGSGGVIRTVPTVFARMRVT